jgi:hypothetical protein
MRKMSCVIAIAIAIAASTLCAGCETETPYFDSRLGSANANMVQAQTLDPGTAGNPATLAPAGADGQRMKSAVDEYHKDVPKAEQPVSRPIFFEVGGSGSGGGG